MCKIYEKNGSRSSSKANTRKACSKSSRANDRDEPMTNVDPTPMKRHINESLHQNAHVHALANQIQAMASNNGTLHPAHMGASRFPFDRSRAILVGNNGTPPAHMASMLPDQSQAMTRRFSNQSQVMAINHGIGPLSPMANMFPSQSRVMTSNHGTPPPAHSNHGTPPPAHMACRFPNQPPTNNTNCLSSSINTNSLPTNNTNFLLRKRECYTNLSSLFCPQRREQAINNLVQLQAKRDADRKFPPGIKFRPTDLELIQFYLYFKIKDNRVPWWNRITEVKLYNHSPDFLAGYCS